MHSIEKEISSAEMTCTWRCDEPIISQDNLSIRLATTTGINKAREYQRSQYPLASRHFSLRAGFFLKYAKQLIATKEYNSVISLGSGLSLLTHCLTTSNDLEQKLIYIDSDIKPMIEARIEHLNSATHLLPLIKKAQRMENLILDVELAYTDSLMTNKTLRDFLPHDCTKPIIIIEGLSYFLTEPCLNWIFDGLTKYSSSAIIFDYWPENAPQLSTFFEKVLTYFKTSLPENVQSLISPTMFSKYTKNMQIIKDCTLDEIEQEMIVTNDILLKDPNTYIPARICILKNNSGT